MALTLSVLTLNIWGIPIISKDKEVRVRSKKIVYGNFVYDNWYFSLIFPDIADKLAQSDYDIISLQEVWSEYDYKRIKERISVQFPFSHYFYSGEKNFR